MSVFFDISVSLDGFVAGPDMRPGAGLGDGGERLHEWAFATEAFGRLHGGRAGGEPGADSDIIDEVFGRAGAHVMGKRMFGGGDGAWGSDPVWGDEPWEGWWGDEPPFRAPVFVVTHHAREPLVKGETTFHFVTGGVEEAVAQAKEAAAGKDVSLGGGANVAQQALAAGLVDQVQLHVAPVLLGDGTRLFDGVRDVNLEPLRVVTAPGVVHLQYRVVR
jgi:dihydrofolate reductase